MACRLGSRAGVAVVPTEMTTLLDCVRRGAHLMRHELCFSSCGSKSTLSTSLCRVFYSGCWPSSVAMAGPWPSWASSTGSVGFNRKSPMTQLTSRRSAASGSITQEEIADVGTITMGQFIVQGLREEMEDEIVMEVDGPNGFSYAGVFDGHAGAFSAQFLRDELYKDCLSALEGGALLLSENLQDAEEALSRAFLQTDKRLISRLELSKVVEEAESGSTATVLFARSDRLVLAYVGDCRAVLSRNGKAEDLTSDHRPFGREKKAFAEIKRIQEAGGWVTHGRLCGYLSVSRAFGDIPFKLKTKKQKMLDSGIVEKRWNDRFAAEKNVDGEWLIATPDTTSMLLQDEVEFIIVASDGLWDSLKSADAVNFVRKRLKEHGDVQRATEEVGQEALNRGAQDNVSVIIVDFGRLKEDTGGSSWKFW